MHIVTRMKTVIRQNKCTKHWRKSWEFGVTFLKLLLTYAISPLVFSPTKDRHQGRHMSPLAPLPVHLCQWAWPSKECHMADLFFLEFICLSFESSNFRFFSFELLRLREWGRLGNVHSLLKREVPSLWKQKTEKDEEKTHKTREKDIKLRQCLTVP